ncbi:hypothetical protein V1289_005124 [Bradyrhizobium sp. AZCC 2289]
MPAGQLFAAAKETGNVALHDLLIERFPDTVCVARRFCPTSAIPATARPWQHSAR